MRRAHLPWASYGNRREYPCNLAQSVVFPAPSHTRAMPEGGVKGCLQSGVWHLLDVRPAEV